MNFEQINILFSIKMQYVCVDFFGEYIIEHCYQQCLSCFPLL